MSKGALDGIVVVDASNFVFGPVATQMLGDLGADVIKVEPPEGDPTRGIGASRSKGMGSFFLNLNRNKRSVVLDLKKTEDAESMRQLLKGADVFVHNMRSGPLRKLGLDYASLRERFPRLIHAAALGFGSSGEYFDRPAYDDVIQGLSGIVGINGAATGTPAYCPMLLSDKLCGVYLANAITTALFHRERTGRAQQIEVPMFETMVSFNLLDHLADNVLHTSSDSEDRPWLGYGRMMSPNHRPLATKDGHISLIANTDAQWHRLFELIGRAELRADSRFDSIGNRMRNISALYETVERQLAERTTSEWLTALKAADIPCGPIHTLEGVRNDPHLAQRQFFKVYEHPTEGPLVMPEVPNTFSDSPGTVRRTPPKLGEHNQQLLAGAGNG